MAQFHKSNHGLCEKKRDLNLVPPPGPSQRRSRMCSESGPAEPPSAVIASDAATQNGLVLLARHVWLETIALKDGDRSRRANEREPGFGGSPMLGALDDRSAVNRRRI